MAPVRRGGARWFGRVRRWRVNIYVESNFLLELAALQEQHESCSRLLEMAEASEVTLVVPAFSILEPYQVLFRRRRDRRELGRRLLDEQTQLGRSATLHDQMPAFDVVREALTRSAEDEYERMKVIRERLQSTSTIIPLDAAVLFRASALGAQFAFGPEDSVVLASVLSQLERTPGSESLFVTRNFADFGTPALQQELATLGCALLFDYGAAVARIVSRPR